MEASNIPNGLFMCHGSPMMAIENDEYTIFLKKLGDSMKPKGIVIFTAHWTTDVINISSIAGTIDTIYDFGGFDQELYQIKYPAQGSPELASKIEKLLSNNGIKSVLDNKRGLDHGSWVLLSRMYPIADIPVVQISVNPKASAKEHIDIGKALKDLNKDNILLIGSGTSVHNFDYFDRSAEFNVPTKWSKEFDEWIIETTTKKDTKSLENYEKLAPYAQLAIASKEHFVPLLIAYGTHNDINEVVVLNRHYIYGSFSFLCLKF